MSGQGLSQPDPATMFCLVRDPLDRHWLQLDRPLTVLTASTSDELDTLMVEIESAAGEGNIVAGYIAYEAAQAFDPGLSVHKSSSPLAIFGVFDHWEVLKTLPVVRPGIVDVRPDISEGDYLARIDKIKRWLQGGESYQVNFTHPLFGTYFGDPLDVFAQLYDAQPTPYATYLAFEEQVVASVSPELFFKLEGDVISMEPMKGTAPRGLSPEADAENEQMLRTSLKDQAENLMIVDMIRNDLGRIALPGSIKVTELFKLQALPTVWQQTSTITADTKANLQEILKALFPCASITGAPKHRTMEIINELESRPRGVYTGAIGVLHGPRSMRFSVGIRTLTLSADGRAEFGVGSGVVWESTGPGEWQESLDKAKVLEALKPPELIETMRFDPGAGVSLWPLHLARLARSSQVFQYPFDPLQAAKMVGAIESSAAQRLRLKLSSEGELTLESGPLPDVQSVVRLAVAMQPVHSQGMYLRHKSTRREIYSARMGARPDVDDVVLFNERGEITETCIYNVYLVFGDQWFTPALKSGLLPGVYRQDLIDQGRVTARVLRLADLYEADQIFVSNAVRGLIAAELILPV